MKLTTRELTFLRNLLISRKAYAHSDIPLGATVWDEMQEKLFDKINHEFHFGEIHDE